jgi:hypothetical protein
MGLERLTVDSLAKIDFGSIAEAFKTHIERLVRDCVDRPGVKSARKVALELKLTPVAQVRGTTIDCDGAKGVFCIKSSIPNHETQAVDFGVRSDGSLVFNEDSPRDHRQSTLLPAGDDNEESEEE